jgi:transcriptional regulator with GAF, ATPase, and Fis domain
MPPRWPLSIALASIEPDVWASTTFEALGLIQPSADGRLLVQIRTRLAVSEALADAAALEPGGEIHRVRSVWNLGPLVRVPVGSDGVELFAAGGPSADTEPQVAAVARLAERVAAISDAGESIDALDDRLTRVDAVGAVLHTLESALDLREVFSELSVVARRVLPHDFSIVSLHENRRQRIRMHALVAPPGWTMPDVIDNPYPTTLSETWTFNIIHDLSVHPIERNMPATLRGLRSAIRVPIRLGENQTGALDFGAFAPHRYTDADLPVVRRIGEYVALALSHRRLADDAREAAEVHERAANLELLDNLLSTLAGALDVRDVFGRVSAISHKVMTHDAMSISIPSDDGQRWTIHVATGYLEHLPMPYVMAAPTPRLLDSHWDFELVGDMRAHARYAGTPSVEAGMRAMLSIPVWVEGRLGSTVNFYSREPEHFTKDDVLVGRRIADHLALALSHQRLAEESGRKAALQSRAAKLDLLDELLAALTDQSSLADMFDRISTIAKRVLTHDMLVLAVVLPDGATARAYARAGAGAAEVPATLPIPPEFVGNDDWEYDIVGDSLLDPNPRNLHAARLGYRSALRVPIRFDGKFAAAVAFLAYPTDVYTQADVHAARRIADRLALALSCERGTEAAKRADEASARATKLESRVRALTEELDARTGYRRVVGESASWREAVRQATQVAATDTTVLLLGESGTGKEVVARFVHRASARSGGPFVALNCAALPEQLLEAELFGYERGAFTGATQSKPGQLEQAGGGTLFLDEVGEMALPAQAKFLRVLQEREFQRLGGTRVLKTDARIVAATNRDLPRALAQGTFREDLFYRLNVFAIRLPPLRDRRDDILALSEAFLADIARGLGRPPSGISRDARKALMDYHWPGNVRELRNILERAAILCEGGLITQEHLSLGAVAQRAAVAQAPAAAKPQPPAPPSSATDLKSMERKLIEQALRDARFNKSKAAGALGLTRAQLYVRMKRYGLE